VNIVCLNGGQKREMNKVPRRTVSDIMQEFNKKKHIRFPTCMAANNNNNNNKNNNNAH